MPSPSNALLGFVLLNCCKFCGRLGKYTINMCKAFRFKIKISESVRRNATKLRPDTYNGIARGAAAPSAHCPAAGYLGGLA